MAVFTSVSLDDLAQWATQFSFGKVLAIRGISTGIENSNFFITTEDGEFVLTVFEKLSFEQLPFYLNLMLHLAERGVLVPRPLANDKGEIISALHGKPACVVTKLKGECQLAPEPVHCAAVGGMLARMHLAAQDFPMRQPNLRGLEWKLETAPRVMDHIPDEAQSMLQSEMRHLEEFTASSHFGQLPQGPIHADLFRNNVMFDGDQLTGFFDFYFAGCDTWLFDVAVTVNDWCIDLASGELDPRRVRAMIDAYHAVRPFNPAEHAAWQTMLRAAALRFWLSRLYDFYQPREAEMLTPHDPAHFERILRLRIAHSAPPLY